MCYYCSVCSCWIKHFYSLQSWDSSNHVPTWLCLSAQCTITFTSFTFLHIIIIHIIAPNHLWSYSNGFEQHLHLKLLLLFACKSFHKQTFLSVICKSVISLTVLELQFDQQITSDEKLYDGHDEHHWKKKGLNKHHIKMQKYPVLFNQSDIVQFKRGGGFSPVLKWWILITRPVPCPNSGFWFTKWTLKRPRRFNSWLCIYWVTADLKIENENASGFPL